MKHKLLLLALAFTAVAPLTTRAEDEVSFEFFYDNLSPYGDWVEVGDYGTCFRPRGVDAEWSPYTDGYWSYTDAGWTWISYEDFGDITYHYGRWVRVNDVGWCWVPDYEWGPAWVSWRKSDDYIGWAPLPPEARWRSSVGFSVWVDDYYDIGPSYYSYCPTVEFGAPVIRHVCVPRARAIGLFGLTVNITNISYNSYSRHVFCGGPDFLYINRVCRRPVPALKLVQNTNIVNNNVTIINNQRIVRAPRNAVAGNTLQVFAPKVVNKSATKVIKPQITQVIAKPQIDKGWTAVKDPGEVKKFREKVKAESKGLTPDTAPARPVAVADLKPLPDKPDTSAPSPVQVAPRPGKPGSKPGKGNTISVLPTEPKPGANPATLPPAVTKPSVLPAEKPGKVAVDEPGKPGRIDAKPGKGAKPGKAGKPAATADNPLVKPFIDPNTPPATVDRTPVAPPKNMKGADDTAERIARQQQEAAASQRRMAEQAERQRAAEANSQRIQKEQSEARRQKMENQRPPQSKQPKVDYSEQQRAAAQRQATMQRQAEAQQRALQNQRQESLQRQMQNQRQSQPQRQFQPQPQQQRQQYQPMPKSQPQQRQQMPPASGGGGKGGKSLTPEQLEALKKQQR